MSSNKWRDPLADALSSGDEKNMKQALENTPPGVLKMAVLTLKEQANTHYHHQNYREALELDTQILAIDDSDFYVWFRRADCLFQLERYEEAQPVAANCVKLKQDHFDSWRLLGRICLKRKDKAAALAALRKALELKPKRKGLAAQVESLARDIANTEKVLKQVLDPDATPEEPEEQPPLPERPDVGFDPQLLLNGEGPDPDTPMYKGVRYFIQSFADLYATREVIRSLEDPQWLDFWVKTAQAGADKRTLIWGSAAGILPLKMLEHKGAEVVSWEPFPSVRRLADGIVQKNQLMAWRASVGDGMEALSKEERETALEAYAAGYTPLPGDPAGLDKDKKPAPCKRLIMTHMDHGLLGSGLVADMRSCREHLLEEKAEIFPARANIYVMAIQWISELDGQELKGLDDFRWSPYPRRVDLNMGGWRGLSKPQKVADLNLADFESCELELALALENSGTLHGFVFWFELAGNGLNLNTGPDGTNWPGQAFQYCDPADVNEKDQLAVTLHVTEDRLFFQTTPPISQIRKGSLPRWAFGHGSSSNWFTTYRKSMVRALKQYQPKTLLNIGAGDGLLALAAAAGDTHIYAVERSTNLCEGLRQNLKALGLSDRVTVLNHDPRELKHPEHLPQKADMVLFDNFDCGLLGDGALHYLQHALEHLTVEKPVLLPRSAVIKAKLIERRLDTLADQDVSLLTPYLFAPDYQEVYLNQTPHRSLSDDFEVFRFDFAAAKVEEQEKDFQVTISQQGIVGAVVFWFELQLDDETTLSTHPSTCEGERGQGLQFLAEVNVEPGTELGMKVKHTGSNLIFALKPDGISEEQIVQLPRFDPRWMSMHQNLMQQTGQMMQQLQTSPEEFAKVVDLAARLAAHPACYGVDPATADRYLNSFMVI